MDGREIPGFYFDPEKKKYFKIQNARHAPRPDSKYSFDNVRQERKKQKAQQVAELKKKKQQKETIVRRLRQAPLMCASLEREIGLRKTAYYMHTAWPDSSISLMSKTPPLVIDRPGRNAVRLFDRDPVTKTLYAVHADNQIKRQHIGARENILPTLEDEELGSVYHNPTLNEYSFEPWDELHRLTSAISSFQYLPITGALAATTYGSDRAPVIHLSDPDRDGPYVAQQFTPKGVTSIWTSKARPASFSLPRTGSDNSVPATEIENLAVGTSNSMLLFSRSSCGTWNSTIPFESASDILAVDWLAPRTIVMGCRNGNIHLHDTRSRGSSRILKHPFAISSLARTDDETRLVCAGLQDSLCLYDIRSSRLGRSTVSNRTSTHDDEKNFYDMYPYRSRRKSKKEDEEGDEPYYGRHKKRKIAKSARSEHCSQPILTFQHSNTDDLQLGFDVHPQMGLVAAAQYLGSDIPAVRIHNLWTGKVVREIDRASQMLNSTKHKAQMQCLKFMDVDDGLELWTTWDGNVVRFS